MQIPPMSTSRRIRFEKFEVDFTSGELRKNGLRIRLQDQPLKVLSILVDRAGDIVTREELQQAVWSKDTFVDFEHGLNKAINKLREALGDTAEHSRFIETLPRRGYRLVAKLESPALPLPTEDGPTARVHWRSRKTVRLVTSGLVIGSVVLFALNVRGLRDRLLNKPVPPAITSLAVLPFENLTGDPNQGYFIDGLHDELITQLAQVSSLKVISRTSVLRYKQQRLPMRQIAQELDVDGVLEGTVRRDGDRLHVTAQLIAAREDRHVWARSYEREMREASAVPGEIARAVTAALNIELSRQELDLLRSTQSADPAVYAAYLKGRYFQSKYSNEGFHRAIEFFQEAIAKDPGYAPAWTELGVSYTMLSGYGFLGKDLSEQEATKKASAALERAVELDPHLSKPHRFLCLMKLNDWDWEAATRENEKARELDTSWHGGTYFLTLSGQLDEAILAARQNVEKDPFGYSSQNILGWTYFMAGRYDESIAVFKQAVAMDAANHYAHFQLGRDYALKGMFPEAITECDTALALLRQKEPEAVAAPDCGWVYAMAGRRRQALEIARTLDYRGVAHIYDALGERDKALEWLERAYRSHDLWVPRLWNVPIVSAELRADPRFQELMRRTGNPWIHFPRRGDSLASTEPPPAPQKQP